MFFWRRAVAAMVAVFLLATPSAFAAVPPAASASLDNGWPRQITKNGATLIYYQPQIDNWKDYKELDGRVAFSLTPQGGKNVLGVASVTAGTNVNNDTRTVYLHDVTYTSIRFPSLDASAASQMETLMRAGGPDNGGADCARSLDGGRRSQQGFGTSCGCEERSAADLL